MLNFQGTNKNQIFINVSFDTLTLLGNFFEIVLVSKSAPRERTASERKMLLTQPAAGGECRKRHSLFLQVSLMEPGLLENMHI